ncbi:hypothetical protein SSX86_017484 [Deinandra increscens subsp. villosa]|uniref:Transmembrane protein n=1 Tax=Deinandra increscens subsp. villosa TaxID=3103831 RepID=A0AAP0GUA8_9ASTR
METPPPHSLHLSGILAGQLSTVDHPHTFTTYHLFYILIVYLLSLCAIAPITYTTFHGFSGQPVTFSTAVKSLTSSFFPIVTTAITSHTLIFLISLTFPMFVGTNLILLHNLGFVIDPTSISFTWLFYVTVAINIAIVTYFHVNWSLAFVVVVAESKSGVAALVRSSELVKGMRSVSLWLGLYFGFFFGISVWVLSDGVHVISDRGYVLLAMMAGSGLLMSYMWHCTAAPTVLYCYCKDFHGELGVDVKIPLEVEGAF